MNNTSQTFRFVCEIICPRFLVFHYKLYKSSVLSTGIDRHFNWLPRSFCGRNDVNLTSFKQNILALHGKITDLHAILIAYQFIELLWNNKYIRTNYCWAIFFWRARDYGILRDWRESWAVKLCSRHQETFNSLTNWKLNWGIKWANVSNYEVMKLITTLPKSPDYSLTVIKKELLHHN